MTTRIYEWFSYECTYNQHSRCHEREDLDACSCRCHAIGDDEWWNYEPPIALDDDDE